jgi:hypothetical protein
MSTAPAVIIKRGGFFSTVAQGIFGCLMVLLICGTVLGLYGMHLWDKHALTITRELAGALPEWRRVLPPAIVDALNDQRAADYRGSLAVSARVATSRGDEDERVVVIDVANKGDKTVSLLALRVVLEDGQHVPVQELNVIAATPLALGDCDWRGPLQPGAQRVLAERIGGAHGELKPVLEIADVRIWREPAVAEPPAALPAPATAAPAADTPAPTAGPMPAAPGAQRP